MIKKIAVAATVVAATLALNGCATMFGDSNRTVSVNSQPAGANVFLNGQPVGVTPTQIQLAQVSGNYIQIQKAGYQSTNMPIATTFQGVGWLNILFWPGFIVDAATGDMMKIQNPNVTITLMPVTPVAAEPTAMTVQASSVSVNSNTVSVHSTAASKTTNT